MLLFFNPIQFKNFITEIFLLFFFFNFLINSCAFLEDNNEFNVNIITSDKLTELWSFPGGSVVKNPPVNAGDTGSIPGLGRSHISQSN